MFDYMFYYVFRVIFCAIFYAIFYSVFYFMFYSTFCSVLAGGGARDAEYLVKPPISPRTWPSRATQMSSYGCAAITVRMPTAASVGQPRRSCWGMGYSRVTWGTFWRPTWCSHKSY